MSLFDLWDDRDKLARRLADGTPYECCWPDDPCETPGCACSYERVGCGCILNDRDELVYDCVTGWVEGA